VLFEIIGLSISVSSTTINRPYQPNGTGALEFQVLSTPDADEVFGFAERSLRQRIPDENEFTFASWSAPWRRESLEHYMRLGWSFIARESNETVGFFLAQPFLFFRSQTQTLWVEHIEAGNQAVIDALVDVAVRVAREKHLQRVLFIHSPDIERALTKWNSTPLAEKLIEVKTTKG
jgi:hypothetical protein